MLSRFMKQLKQSVLLLFLLGWVFTPSLSAAQAPSRTKLRIATASPSLSYLPIYTAVKKGFLPGAALM
jgi:ABC-type nitrate/sulfonate/bicarbonate transport system substrate-binding protein